MHRLLLSCVALGAAIASSAQALAQFQEPAKEELQMTDDSKAPGAKAVYLYLEDAQDEAHSTRTYYERIKILTEKGKEQATVRFTHIADTKFHVEARTIHKDGTVIAMLDKPSDLVEFKTKESQINTLVFTLPSAEVGSILEYRVTFKNRGYLPFPTWMIQQDIFVHKAHYSYKAALTQYVGFSARLARGMKVIKDQRNGYSLDVQDVDPLPIDDWMPPLNTFKWRVYFFYAQFRSAKDFWDFAGSRWAESVRSFITPTSTLAKAAASMVVAGDSETVKAQKIYAAVMNLENTDFTREKTKEEKKKAKTREIRNAEDVWREQGGSRVDIALLFVALCQTAGLNVTPMNVVDRSRALFDEGVFDSAQMDDYIAVGKLDGREVYFDPGEKMCPFGLLRWTHSFSSGFRLEGNVAKIALTPAPDYQAASLERNATLTLAPDGKARGEVHIVLQGQEALRWRQMVLLNDKEEVKRQFLEWVQNDLPEGIQGEFDHFTGLDDYNSNLVADLKVTGALGSSTGRRFFIPRLFFDSKSNHPFVAEKKREIPVDLHYARCLEDRVTYKLPSDFGLEGGSDPAPVNWPEHAHLSITTTGGSDHVEVTRKLIEYDTFIWPKEYDALRDFYQKVSAADQQPVILTRSDAAKGN